MNFTSREEYGLLAILNLAENEGAGPTQTKEIAKAEDIPEQFLEQVLGSLRRAGVVRSIRGAAGGYELARPAGEITPGDVLRALSGEILPIQPRSGNPDKDFVVVDLWEKVRTAITDVLDGMTIRDMADERRRHRRDFFMMNI